MAIEDLIQIEAPKAKLLIEIDNDIEWIDIQDLTIFIFTTTEQIGISDELIDKDIIWKPTQHDFKPIYRDTIVIEGDFEVKTNNQIKECIKNNKYNIKILDSFVITKDNSDRYSDPHNKTHVLDIIECETELDVINYQSSYKIFHFLAKKIERTKKEIINETTESIIDKLLSGIKDDIWN